MLLTKLRNAVINFQDGQEGEDLVEYAIVFILFSIILISTLNALAAPIDNVLVLISSSL